MPWLAAVLLATLVAACSGTDRGSPDPPSGGSGAAPADTGAAPGPTDDPRPLPRLGPDEPRTRWSRRVGTQIDWLRAGGDRAFFVTSEGERQLLVAVDQADGHELWRHELPFGVFAYVPLGTAVESESPILMVDPVVVIVGQLGDDAIAVDPATGDEVWSLQDAEPYRGLTVAGRGADTCVVASGDTATGMPSATCLDARSGGARWEVEGTTVAAHDDQVFVQRPEGLAAVDLTTGATDWTVPAVEPEIVLPAASVVLGCQEEVLSAFDRGSGDLLWRLDVGTDDLGSACEAVFVGQRKAFVTPWEAPISTVDLATGERTESEVASELVPPGSQGETTVYGDRWITGKFASVDARTGRGRSARDTADGGPRPGTLFTVDHVADAVLRLSNTVDPDGGSYLVSVTSPQGEELWSQPMGWGEPDLVPTDDGLLVANLGSAGVLWSGGPDGDGPGLGQAVEEATAEQVVPASPLALGASAVLGVPLGTPMAEAEARLTELLGPPTRRDDRGTPDAAVPPTRSWGTLIVGFSGEPGAELMDSWSIPEPAFGPPWPLPGGITALSPLAEIEAAGYAPTEPDLLSASWCAPGIPSVCVLFGGEDVVDPPGPTDTPTVVTRRLGEL